jgi:hypothetical protein
MDGNQNSVVSSQKPVEKQGESREHVESLEVERGAKPQSEILELSYEEFAAKIAHHLCMKPEFIKGVLYSVRCIFIEGDGNPPSIYDYIEELNETGLIKLRNYKGGSYCTKLPISPLEFRIKYPTQASINIISGKSHPVWKSRDIAVLYKDDSGVSYALIQRYFKYPDDAPVIFKLNEKLKNISVNSVPSDFGELSRVVAEKEN